MWNDSALQGVIAMIIGAICVLIVYYYTKKFNEEPKQYKLLFQLIKETTLSLSGYEDVYYITMNDIPIQDSYSPDFDKVKAMYFQMLTPGFIPMKRKVMIEQIIEICGS